MALDPEVSERMGALHADLQQAVNEVVDNTALTEDAQAAMVAQALLDARAQADALRDNFVNTATSTAATLESQLYGLPAGADAATVLAHRDAVDRAAKLSDPDELSTALARARRNGDASMARAIAGRAAELHYDDIATDYATGAGLTEKLRELKAVPTGRNFGAAVALQFNVRVPSLPPVIADRIRAADGRAGGLRKLADAKLTRTTKPHAKTYRSTAIGGLI